KLETRDVVRSDRSALGNALTQHADARYCDGYPGMCLLEGTNISEGRGTTRPFEIFGAPFIEAEKFCSGLNALKLPGVFFRENYFQPTFQKFAGELCGGAQIYVLDRDEFRPFLAGVEIIKHIRKTYPEQFQWKRPPYEYEWKQ